MEKVLSLSDYLRRKGSEVRNMLIAEYSYEKDIQVKQEEAKQEGREEGRKEGRKEGREEGMILTAKIFRAIKQNSDLTNEQIAEKVGCTVQDVENTRRMFGM